MREDMSDNYSDDLAHNIDDYKEYFYHDDSLYHDQWDWGSSLTPVPGFGFFPPRVAQELDHMTQVGFAVCQTFQY